MEGRGKNKKHAKERKKKNQMVIRVPLISSANEMAPMFISMMNLLHMFIYILFTYIISLSLASALASVLVLYKNKMVEVCLVGCGDGELQIQSHCHFSVNWEVNIGNNSLILFHQFEARALHTLHSNHFFSL